MSYLLCCERQRRRRKRENNLRYHRGIAVRSRILSQNDRIWVDGPRNASPHWCWRCLLESVRTGVSLSEYPSAAWQKSIGIQGRLMRKAVRIRLPVVCRWPDSEVAAEGGTTQEEQKLTSVT